jgi:serine/threonine-protein kinase RsbW
MQIIGSFVGDVGKIDLARIRHFVEETGAQIDLAPSVITALRQAIDEAVSNIVFHGYQGQVGPLKLDIGQQGTDLWVRLRDAALPFDPTKVPAPDLTVPLPLRPPGGLGLYLIRQSIDELLYHPIRDGGNELIMIKRDVVR